MAISGVPSSFQDMRTMSNFWHAVDGIFLWEFFTTLNFEWSVIRGNRPYRWTIWIYSLTRIAALMAVILDIIELDAYTPINCQLGIIFELIFSYLTLACASLLLMLRVVAIWKRNKIVLALATTVWTTNVAVLIQGIVRMRSVWTSEEGCLLSNSDIAKLNFVVTLATDIILFLMMLAGLLYLRLEGGGTLSLGDFLWKQGVIWFFLAAVAEIPPAVFLFLNMNESFNLMFQIPALIVLAIAATRMYRSLINFSSDTADGISSSGRSFPKVSGFSRAIPPNRMHVAIHTTRERDSVSQTNQFNPHICIDEQLHVKAWGLGSEGDLEGGVEK